MSRPRQTYGSRCFVYTPNAKDLSLTPYLLRYTLLYYWIRYRYIPTVYALYWCCRMLAFILHQQILQLCDESINVLRVLLSRMLFPQQNYSLACQPCVLKCFALGLLPLIVPSSIFILSFKLYCQNGEKSTKKNPCLCLIRKSRARV